MLDPGSIELALVTLQQRIDQLHQSLAQQNKLATLGMVTAVIAHEFNNILTPMIAYTKFALGDKADTALREKALTKALSGAERLANISKSLLGFARGDEASTTANVAVAIRETLACLSRDLGKDGITLTCDVPDDLWVSINAGHLQQVLMNLIVNARSAMLNGGTIAKSAAVSAETGTSPLVRGRAAIEAMRKAPAAGVGAGAVPVRCGVKRLTIRAERTLGGKRVELSIADTGPGIPADVLPRIFDPFFSTKKRGEKPLNEGGAADEEAMPQGGTGLGLTICKELVAAAGGTIRAASEAGKGATFVLELAVMTPPEGAGASPGAQIP
jgi:signal transduction histidine kinase